SGHGGNGFMDVSATHAALLLAQGTGRLIRNGDGRGVVAVLDPRLVTARYGNFLTASLPPMWRTTDRAVTTQALTRLNATTDLSGCDYPAENGSGKLHWKTALEYRTGIPHWNSTIECGNAATYA